MPNPPIHCVMLRQKRSPWGSASISSRMVAPVLLNPDIVYEEGIGYAWYIMAEVEREHSK
mgnify:CR=1 FL=1